MVRILFNDSQFQWFVLWVQTGPKIDPQTGPGGFWKRVVEAPLNQVGSEFPLAAFTGPLLQSSGAFLGLQLIFLSIPDALLRRDGAVCARLGASMGQSWALWGPSRALLEPLWR